MSSCLPLFLSRPMSHAATTSLPHASDILPWKWRPQKQPQEHIVLPPITYFDLKVLSPPPPSRQKEDIRPLHHEDPPSPVVISPSTRPTSPMFKTSSAPWYGSGTPASAVAEKTAEMICYLWFSSNRELASRSSSNAMRSRSRTRHSPTFAKLDAAAAALQFAATTRFVQFIRKLLETTQVSQSVIVLSLHYVFRLRQQNSMTAAQEGSEFRVAVIAMMLANKFVDDNTYTNKTWSEVAGIELDELNRMEREFLLGIDSRLYVDKATYDSWLQLLKGLVLAKERDQSHWRLSLRHNAEISPLAPRPRHPIFNSSVQYTPTHRPRSSSPVHSAKFHSSFTFNLPHSHSQSPCGVTVPHDDTIMEAEFSQPSLGLKRSAYSAFDSDVPAPPSRPPKRAIALQTDGLPTGTGPQSAGPAFTSCSTPYADAFAKLSISNTPQSNRLHPSMAGSPHSPMNPSSRKHESQTLAQPYHIDQQTFNTQPQHLYFYTLSGSPSEPTDIAPNRKSKLRYAPLQSPVRYPITLPPPLVIQSAHSSPRNLGLRQAGTANYDIISTNHHHVLQAEPPKFRLHPPRPHISQSTGLSHSGNSIPVAPFANAGPPGVQWMATTPIEGRSLHVPRPRRF